MAGQVSPRFVPRRRFLVMDSVWHLALEAVENPRSLYTCTVCVYVM